MACFSCNTIVLRTPAGILKIFEFVRFFVNFFPTFLNTWDFQQVLVFICLMLARFGNDGNIMRFAKNDFGSDLTFLGIGTLVGYAIIVPSILATYLMGANLTFLVRKTPNTLTLDKNPYFFRNSSLILWVEFFSW